MKLTWATLLITETTWTLGLSDGTPASTLDIPAERSGDGPKEWASLVDTAVRTVKEAGAKIGPLVVGLPSAWCFSSTVSTEGLSRRQRIQGLTYRLEEKLPIDAEAFTADFVETDRDAWGVAAVNRRVEGVLGALESAGLSVAHFCPTALLIHDAWSASKETVADGILVVASQPETIDILQVNDHRVTAWRSVPAHDQLVDTEIRQLSSSGTSGLPVQYLGIDPDRQSRINLDQATGCAELVANHGHQLLRQGKEPAIDLRRGVLKGQGVWTRVAHPARLAAAAAVLLCLSVTAGNLWTTHHQQRLTTSHQDQQAALFRDTFPGQRVPAAPLSRFRSEAAKSRGMAGSGEAIPSPPRTLYNLQTLLASLPVASANDQTAIDHQPARDAMRFRVFEVRLEPDRFYLDGHTRSHADAERLADGLRSSLPYTMNPPRTQNLRDTASSHSQRTSGGGAGGFRGGGVSFTLTGQRLEGTP